MRRVSYSVDSARVEQRTDLDKLIMDIETNGAIEPEEAIRTRRRVLNDQLSVFDLEGKEEAASKVSGAVDPILLARRRPGAHRAQRELPEGGEHPLIGVLIQRAEMELLKTRTSAGSRSTR